MGMCTNYSRTRTIQGRELIKLIKHILHCTLKHEIRDKRIIQGGPGARTISSIRVCQMLMVILGTLYNKENEHIHYIMKTTITNFPDHLQPEGRRAHICGPDGPSVYYFVTFSKNFTHVLQELKSASCKEVCQ